MAGLAEGRRALVLLNLARAGGRIQISATTKRIATRFIQGASPARDPIGPAIEKLVVTLGDAPAPR